MKVAKFAKVSREQFKRDLTCLVGIFDDIYDDITIPVRATRGSAGYDFFSPIDIDIAPGAFAKIPTGIRCYIEDGYFLSLYPRSSLGFKFQMALANTVGIIDADYYNSSNEGHIICGIVNHGERIISIRKGDRFCQGIFLPYLLAEEDEVLGKRDGGFGSSGS